MKRYLLIAAMTMTGCAAHQETIQPQVIDPRDYQPGYGEQVSYTEGHHKTPRTEEVPANDLTPDHSTKKAIK